MPCTITLEEAGPNSRCLIDECIEDLLQQVGKSDCEQSAVFLRRCLEGGGYPDPENPGVHIFALNPQADNALHALLQRTENTPAEQKELAQNMVRLRDALEITAECLDDGATQELLMARPVDAILTTGA